MRRPVRVVEDARSGLTPEGTRGQNTGRAWWPRAPREEVRPISRCERIVKLAELAGPLVFLAVASQPSVSGRLQTTQPGQGAPQVIDLVKEETVPFSVPGPTDINSEIKCGPNGDIYAIYGNAPPAQLVQLARAPISRVSVSSKSVTIYPIPAISGYYSPSRSSLDVRADGTLFALLSTARKSGSESKPEPVDLMVEYKDDGTVDSQFEVGNKPGEHIQPLRMAAFADGNFLLSGTTVGQNQLGTFAGIFDRHGAFVAPLQLAHAVVQERERSGSTGRVPTEPELTRKSEGTAAKQTAAAELQTEAENPVSLESSTRSVSSRDGNIYVLQGTGAATLYVVSPDGRIARQFKLKPPEPGLSPVQMAGAGVGYLFIDYGYIATGAPGENQHQREMIMVLDSGTGQVTALYRLPEVDVDFAVPACAVSPDDFLFLGTSKDNRLEVVRYAVR